MAAIAGGALPVSPDPALTAVGVASAGAIVVALFSGDGLAEPEGCSVTADGVTR